MERRGNHRRGGMSGPHTYAGKHTTKIQCIRIHGVLEREKQSDDIPEVGQHEICVPKPRILVQGILCGHSGEEHSGDKELHIESNQEGQRDGSIKFV